MFETETMAELCLKQGLVLDALAIYRRLLASAPDQATRARHAQRIAELEARDQSRRARPAGSPMAPPSPSPAAAASSAAADAVAIRERHDERQITFEWRLPAGTQAPALQILVLRREASGIATERRTVRLPQAQGTLTLPIAGVHSLRVAAGKLEGERFVPLVRLGPDRAPPDPS